MKNKVIETFKHAGFKVLTDHPNLLLMESEKNPVGADMIFGHEVSTKVSYLFSSTPTNEEPKSHLQITTDFGHGVHLVTSFVIPMELIIKEHPSNDGGMAGLIDNYIPFANHVAFGTLIKSFRKENEPEAKPLEPTLRSVKKEDLN